MTVRELIMELRKVGNHDAVVRIDAGSKLTFAEGVEVEDTMERVAHFVWITDHEPSLSTTRRPVGHPP